MRKGDFSHSFFFSVDSSGGRKEKSKQRERLTDPSGVRVLPIEIDSDKLVLVHEPVETLRKRPAPGFRLDEVREVCRTAPPSDREDGSRSATLCVLDELCELVDRLPLGELEPVRGCDRDKVVREVVRLPVDRRRRRRLTAVRGPVLRDDRTIRRGRRRRSHERRERDRSRQGESRPQRRRVHFFVDMSLACSRVCREGKESEERETVEVGQGGEPGRTEQRARGCERHRRTGLTVLSEEISIQRDAKGGSERGEASRRDNDRNPRFKRNKTPKTTRRARVRACVHSDTTRRTRGHTPLITPSEITQPVRTRL